MARKSQQTMIEGADDRQINNAAAYSVRCAVRVDKK